jgi:uncharacterized protein YtpQ (UPF0354 family)
LFQHPLNRGLIPEAPRLSSSESGEVRIVKWLPAIVAALVLAAGVARADTLTPRAFTERVARATMAAMPSAKVALNGDLRFVVRYANGASASSDLAKAYKSYEREPQHLDDIVQAQVSALMEAGGDANGLPKLDRTRIVPIIKERQWFEAMQRRGREQTPPQELVAEPLNGELVVVYAENRLGALRILSSRDDVGDRTRLRDAALTNLSRLLPKIEIRPGSDGVLLISAGGEFDASLLLADNLWSGGQVKVDGDIVVAVPAKDVLIATGSNNAPGLARLRAAAAKFASGPNGLTTALFVYRDGKFVKFETN